MNSKFFQATTPNYSGYAISLGIEDGKALATVRALQGSKDTAYAAREALKAYLANGRLVPNVWELVEGSTDTGHYVISCLVVEKGE